MDEGERIFREAMHGYENTHIPLYMEVTRDRLQYECESLARRMWRKNLAQWREREGR